MSDKSNFEVWGERVNELKDRIINITIIQILQFLDKLINCRVKKEHDWIRKFRTHDIYGTEFNIYECLICGKTKYEMGPFPPEHENCRCSIKEGENYE